MAINKNILFRYKLRHVLFWLVYSLFWLVIGQLATPAQFRDITKDVIMVNAMYLIVNILASYTCIYLIMPQYLYRKRYVQFALFLLADLLVFSMVIAAGFFYIFRHNHAALDNIFKPSSIVPATFFSVASTVGLVSAAKLFQNKKQAERASKHIEQEKNEVELNYLKAQINPHFLFNVINNIYFLINKDKDVAANMLLRFSELLRYQLYECNTPLLPFDTEIQNLNNYIELEKIRKTHIEVTVNNDITDNTLSIPPLLFTPLVENAFKYARGQAIHSGFINIHFGYTRPWFHFSISNNYVKSTEKSGNSGGIGIDNVRKRLHLQYPGRFLLDINEECDVFSVNLKIDLPVDDK